MHRKAMKPKEEGVARVAAKQVAGQDRTFWQRLFGKYNSPLEKKMEAAVPTIARLKEGDMDAIRRCISDDGIWKAMGENAIDRELISGLAPADALEVFACLAKHRAHTEKFDYFEVGQIRPEMFSAQDALAVAGAMIDSNGPITMQKWLFRGEGFTRMHHGVRRALLFGLLKKGRLHQFEGVMNSRQDGFGKLSDDEKMAVRASIGGVNRAKDRGKFFTRKRLLMFEPEDRSWILALMVKQKQEGAIGIAHSFYSEKEGREGLFNAIVDSRIYAEGMAGNTEREAKMTVFGIFGGMFAFPASVLAVLSAALDMTWGKLLNEGGAAVVFVGVFLGAALGLYASMLIEGALTRYSVLRSEREAMRAAAEDAEGQETRLRKRSEENVVQKA